VVGLGLEGDHVIVVVVVIVVATMLTIAQRCWDPFVNDKRIVKRERGMLILI